MTALRLVLAAQLALFAVWGGWLLTSHGGAAEVWLDTQPVDPRDLLAGHFVALRYPIAVPHGVNCPETIDSPRGTTVWVRVAPTGEARATSEGPVAIATSAECRPAAPDAATGETWLAGEMGDGGIVYGIERFYVPETSALRTARSGDVVAKVAVNGRGSARIVDLVSTTK